MGRGRRQKAEERIQGASLTRPWWPFERATNHVDVLYAYSLFVRLCIPLPLRSGTSLNEQLASSFLALFLACYHLCSPFIHYPLLSERCL